MDVAVLRHVFNAGVPLAGAGDAPVARGELKFDTVGRPAVVCHAVTPRCGLTPHDVTATTVRALTADTELFPDPAAANIFFCDVCQHDQPFGQLMKKVSNAWTMAGALRAVQSRADDLATASPADRNGILRELRLRLNGWWFTGIDDEMDACLADAAPEVTAPAERYAEQVRATWTGPLALTTVRERSRRLWTRGSVDPELDDALAVAENVGKIKGGKFVFAVPAALLERDATWVNLGPVVTGAELDARLAALTSVSKAGFPDLEEMTAIVLATTAALT